MLSWLANLLESCGKAQGIIALISAIFWGIYVLYTIKTFREIKHQTDLQSQAFLVAIVRRSGPRVGGVTWLGDKATAIRDKWKGILQNNVPSAIQPEGTVILKLKNSGKSEIVAWKVHVKVRISPQAYLEQFNVIGESSEWTIESQGSSDIIAADASRSVTISSHGFFPHAVLSWAITYEDMRRNKFTNFAGDRECVVENPLANPSPTSTTNPVLTKLLAAQPEPEPVSEVSGEKGPN